MKQKLKKFLFDAPTTKTMIVLNVSFNLAWVFCLLFFINKSLINSIIIMVLWTIRHIIGKAKHYKTWWQCLLLQISLFSSFALACYINIYVASIFTLFTVFLLSGWSDINIEPEINEKRKINDLTLWNPKNEKENKKYNDLIVKRIEELRKEKNISYNQLAKNSDLSYSTLMTYLNRTNPSASTLIIKKVCDGLEVKECEFYDHKYFK